MRDNRYFLLLVLSVIAVLNFVDRQILSILLQSIKVDLDLTDLQLGLLSGTLFAIFYSLVGIPLARLADRWNRRNIIAASLFVWSSMTVLSGFATSFLHLAMARIGIGIGEGGVQPASHSLIGERFAANERATAYAFYSCGVTIGIVVALLGGGVLSDLYGWRVAFIAAGLPGVMFALVALFLIKEPRQTPRFRLSLFFAGDDEPSLRDSLAFFWMCRSWRYGALAAAFTNIATLGIGGFLPSLIIRSYGLNATQTGLAMAVFFGIFGTAGVVIGGVIADRVSSSKGIQWLPWVPAIAYAIVCILAPVVFLSRELPVFLVLLAPYFALILTSSGVQFSIAQAVVGADQRALSSAMLILVINLVGLGIGPTVVGLLSDQFAPSTGREALRYAMLCMTPLYILGAYFFYRTGVTLPSDVNVLEEASQGSKEANIHDMDSRTPA